MPEIHALGSRFDTSEAVVAVANPYFNFIDSSEFGKTWVTWRTNVLHHGVVTLKKSVQQNKFLELTLCFLLRYTDFQRSKVTFLTQNTVKHQ